MDLLPQRCQPGLGSEQDLQRRNYLKEGESLAPMRVYKSLDRMNFDAFAGASVEAIKRAGGSSVTVRVPSLPIP